MLKKEIDRINTALEILSKLITVGHMHSISKLWTHNSYVDSYTTFLINLKVVLFFFGVCACVCAMVVFTFSGSHGVFSVKCKSELSVFTKAYHTSIERLHTSACIYLW